MWGSLLNTYPSPRASDCPSSRYRALSGEAFHEELIERQNCARVSATSTHTSRGLKIPSTDREISPNALS